MLCGGCAGGGAAEGPCICPHQGIPLHIKQEERKALPMKHLAVFVEKYYKFKMKVKVL